VEQNNAEKNRLVNNVTAGIVGMRGVQTQEILYLGKEFWVCVRKSKACLEEKSRASIP
jgi:hypothetical protein